MSRRSKSNAETSGPSRGARQRGLVIGSGLALLLATAMWLFGGPAPLVRLLFQRNFQPVIAGEVYRSAQPRAAISNAGDPTPFAPS